MSAEVTILLVTFSVVCMLAAMWGLVRPVRMTWLVLIFGFVLLLGSTTAHFFSSYETKKLHEHAREQTHDTYKRISEWFPWKP